MFFEGEGEEKEAGEEAAGTPASKYAKPAEKRKTGGSFANAMAFFSQKPSDEVTSFFINQIIVNVYINILNLIYLI